MRKGNRKREKVNKHGLKDRVKEDKGSVVKEEENGISSFNRIRQMAS